MKDTAALAKKEVKVANLERKANLKAAEIRYNINVACRAHQLSLEKDVYFMGDMEAHMAIFRDKETREAARLQKKNVVAQAKRNKLKDNNVLIPTATPRGDVYVHSLKLTRENCKSTAGVFGNILFNQRTFTIICKHPSSFKDKHAHCPQCWTYYPYGETCCTTTKTRCEVGKIMTEQQHLKRRAMLTFFKNRLDQNLPVQTRTLKASITSQLEAREEEKLKFNGRHGLALFGTQPKHIAVNATKLYLKLRAEKRVTETARRQRILDYEAKTNPPEVPPITKKPRTSHAMIEAKQAAKEKAKRQADAQEAASTLLALATRSEGPARPNGSPTLPQIHRNPPQECKQEVLGRISQPSTSTSNFNPPTVIIKEENLTPISVSNSDVSDSDGLLTPETCVNKKRLASLLNLPRPKRQKKPQRKTKHDNIPKYIQNNNCKSQEQADREGFAFFAHPEVYNTRKLHDERLKYHTEVTSAQRELMTAQLTLEVNCSLIDLRNLMKNDGGYRLPGQPKQPVMCSLDSSQYDAYTGQFRIESLRFPQRYWTEEPIRLTDRVDASQADICYLEQLALQSAMAAGKQNWHINTLRKSITLDKSMPPETKTQNLRSIDFLTQAQAESQRLAVEIYTYIIFMRRRQAMMHSGMSREEALQKLTVRLRPGEKFLFP